MDVQKLMLFYVPIYGAILYKYHGWGYKGLVRAILWLIAPVILVYSLPALRTACVMLVTMLTMLTIAIKKDWFTVRKKRTICGIWAVFLTAPIAAFLGMYLRNRLAEYQIARIQAMFSSGSETDYLTKMLHSLWRQNKLIGKSKSDVTGILPAFNADYILTYLSSVYGIIAAILLCCVLAVLIFAVFNTALRQKNQLGMMMGCGCGIVFLISFLINVLENLGVFPQSITFLPFFSAGGSCVVNSVSYADGRMFRSDFNTYYKGIRETSDELCRENRLSVIETDGKGKSYDEWLSGQAGKPTIRGMVRKDVEQAIAAADSFDGFITELQNMGYTVKYGPRVEHMAVRHKDAQRNIRIDRFDPRFSETALREYYHKLHRMPTEMQQEYRQENAPAKPKWQPTELQPTVRRARYRGKLARQYPNASGFMACYYHYCALLRKAYHGKSTKRCYFLLREDFLLFSRYQQQTKFLWENHIETMDELLAYKENAEVQIQQLARQRKVLYRQKREPERAAREEKIKSLTQQMKALRHEVYICSDIETDAAEVQEKLRQAELAAQEERNEVKQDEQRRRSSRSDGAGSLTGYRSSH